MDTWVTYRALTFTSILCGLVLKATSSDTMTVERSINGPNYRYIPCVNLVQSQTSMSSQSPDWNPVSCLLGGNNAPP